MSSGMIGVHRWTIYACLWEEAGFSIHRFNISIMCIVRMKCTIARGLMMFTVSDKDIFMASYINIREYATMLRGKETE